MTRAEQCRQAQARYKRTAKGKATEARYLRSAAHREAKAANNARRIFVGSLYRGRAQTIEQAAAIQAHIRERVNVFIARQQTGAHLESRASSTVLTSAADRTD